MINHLPNIVDTIIAIAFVEVVAKPTIIRATKAGLLKLDTYIKIIPDWMYKS